MFSFFKKNKEDSSIEVPEWASFFTSDEYSVFIKAVRSYFDKLNLRYTIDDGVVIVDKENDLGFNKLGLQNLSQKCKQNDIKDYESVVTDHFETMIRIHKFGKEFEEIVSDFEKVEKYIGVRLHDVEYAANLKKENMIVREFAEGVVAMLVFDLPESVMNIKPEQIEPWGKTIDELYEIGKRNIKQNCAVNLFEEKVGDHKFWFAEADHFYATNFVMDIQDYPQVVGKKGSLISVPNRHIALIYPIHDLEVVGALNNMLYLTSRMYEDGPGSITDRVYWYNDGAFINIPHRIENEKRVIAPPDVFIDALNELGEAGNKK
ncbi:hypothetical protein D0T84_05190 [Dysgonomonas sp. 521]|uniref:hypothetical protein n=1 Tax=Dysgonomonas sp. 521 TaxID=2302932 RepID=UPI0013D1A7C2|nr:hypothetical protein [Dysgonomonas sp. 521]NDV94313.1 hypothetical protein [Dysgonomonas sp. 521]